jgi:hypothetical protein
MPPPLSHLISRVRHGWVAIALLTGCAPMQDPPHQPAEPFAVESQVTRAPCGHILTNANVWSPDSRWLAYDVRSDVEGSVFDGRRIERVNVESGETQLLYASQRGACCGVVSYDPAATDPQAERIAFILGPEDPTANWSYAANHRQGVFVRTAFPLIAHNLDARDLVAPFTPGALRGGSHLHLFSPDGQWVSFTYEDAVLPEPADPRRRPNQQANARNLGVSVPTGQPTLPAHNHPRNASGTLFSVLVTATTDRPAPGSDGITRAHEEAWIGERGYARPDGSWQRRALAFQGDVRLADGRSISEVFVVDIPEDVTHAGAGPLCGTPDRLPFPPAGVAQRRVTHTEHRRYPGLQGPRHWLRASPDGSRIAFLARDDAGVVQLWTVSPNGGPITQVTGDPWSVDSAFTWSPDGTLIAYVADNSIFTVNAATGTSTRRTPRTEDSSRPLALACVFSPDGRKLAYLRRVIQGSQTWNQIFVATLR